MTPFLVALALLSARHTYTIEQFKKTTQLTGISPRPRSPARFPNGRGAQGRRVAARDYLARLPYVDGTRIAIGGENYGGYMTLAALAFAPDTFAAGVDFYGPSNWIHTLEAVPPYWAAYRKALIAEIGDPVADRAMLESISPFFHAANIRRPLGMA